MDRAKVVLGLELSWTYSQSDSHKKAGHSPVRNGEKGWFPPPFTRDVPLEKETNLGRPRVTSSLQIVQGHIRVIFFSPQYQYIKSIPIFILVLKKKPLRLFFYWLHVYPTYATLLNAIG